MRLFGSLSLVGMTSLVLAAASSAQAIVLYDSFGFESSAGYEPNKFLDFQPASAPVADQWVASPTFPTGAVDSAATVPLAGVYEYPVLSAENRQYVGVVNNDVPANNANFYNPQTNQVNPFTPAPTEGVVIGWSMNTSSSDLANNPFFGIVAFGSNGVIAQAGINASTGELLGSGLFTTVSPFTAAPDTFYNYELLLDYTTQTYSIFAAPTDAEELTLRATGLFANLSTDFTDADIASFSVQPQSGLPYSGFAQFDFYFVETVTIPEPASLCLAIGACGLLGARRCRA
ncbi:MAG TPA: hypothetical protein VF595_06250 [Tepidisphaeraceae bacterium]|jgi:hypothetical protein